MNKFINNFLAMGIDVISSYEFKTEDGIRIKSHTIRPAGVLITFGLFIGFYATYKTIKEAFKDDEKKD